jgi:hypothetical protein
MGLGPLAAAVGLALMLRVGAHVHYVTDLLPALLIFSIGLACTVAPLTAAVLSAPMNPTAGIASGVNNAIARVAGLLAIAAVGAVISGQVSSTLDKVLVDRTLPPAARSAVFNARSQTLSRFDPTLAGSRVADAVESASVDGFHVGIGIAATLVALGAARPDRDSQPPPDCALRGLCRRSARRRAAGHRPAADTNAPSSADRQHPCRNRPDVIAAGFATPELRA